MAKRSRKIEHAGPCRRQYPLREANRALVLVRGIVTDVVSDYVRLVDLQEVIEAAQAAGRSDRLEEARVEVARLVEKLQRALEELELLGLELKDWSLGVVDFPSLADGREVRLTWQLGQDRIRSWHEIHNPTLQPIDTLPEESYAVRR